MSVCPHSCTCPASRNLESQRTQKTWNKYFQTLLQISASLNKGFRSWRFPNLKFKLSSPRAYSDPFPFFKLSPGLLYFYLYSQSFWKIVEIGDGARVRTLKANKELLLKISQLSQRLPYSRILFETCRKTVLIWLIEVLDIIHFYTDLPPLEHNPESKLYSFHIHIWYPELPGHPAINF